MYTYKLLPHCWLRTYSQWNTLFFLENSPRICLLIFLVARLSGLVRQLPSPCRTIHSVRQPEVQTRVTAREMFGSNATLLQVVFDVVWVRQDGSRVLVERLCDGSHLLLLPDSHNSSLLQPHVGSGRHRGVLTPRIRLVSAISRHFRPLIFQSIWVHACTYRLFRYVLIGTAVALDSINIYWMYKIFSGITKVLQMKFQEVMAKANWANSPEWSKIYLKYIVLRNNYGNPSIFYCYCV